METKVLSNVRHVAPRLARGGAVWIVGFWVAGAGASGQTLQIKERPAPESLLCSAPAETPVCSAENRDQVESLIDEATQALILGDLGLAELLLNRVLAMDPCSAEASYLQGRIVAQQEGPVEAAEWFCRYIALSESGGSVSDARNRLQQAVQDGAGADLLADFVQGVTRFEEGQLEEAEERFAAVLQRRPIPDAYYNRGVVRMALGRQAEARADLVRYVELRPDAPDRPAVDLTLQELAHDHGSRPYRSALVLTVGGSVHGDLTPGISATTRLEPGWVLGLQYEHWFGRGRTGVRVNTLFTQRMLDDPVWHDYNIFMGDIDLMVRLLSLDDDRVVAPFAVLGIGATHYGTVAGSAPIAGGRYGENVVRAHILAALGFDIATTTSTGIRVEAGDNIVLPALGYSPTVSGFPLVHNLVVTLGFQWRWQD